MLMIRGIARSLFQTGFFAAVLLIPSGTWNWPRAVQFVVVFGLLSLISIIALAAFAPASLEARIQRGIVKDQPKADRIASAFIALSHLAWFVFIPIDVHRLNLLPPPPLWLSVLGVILCLAGFGVMLAAVWQNSFAAPIVGDQSERGQVLIDSGLYGRVRHPLYLGHLLFLTGLPLWLQSFAGLIALPLVFAPVVARIYVEERTLRETLPGYAEYMSKVPRRLVPFVW
jgi:protein-S-isoprenylcysteine O-methyltransferase Ste14